MRSIKLIILCGLLYAGVFKVVSQPKSNRNDHTIKIMPISVEVTFKTNRVLNTAQIWAKAVEAIKERGGIPIETGTCVINILINSKSNVCNVLLYTPLLGDHAEKLQQIKINNNCEIVEVDESPEKHYYSTYEANGGLKIVGGVVFERRFALDYTGLMDRAIKSIKQKGWKPIEEGSCLIQLSMYDEPACTVSFNAVNRQTQKVCFNKLGQITSSVATIR
jgi:hypothetical protein